MDKIYLDSENTIESHVNNYLTCRDGSVSMYEYYDNSGYGCKTRLYICDNWKSDSVCIVRQSLPYMHKDKDVWEEEVMTFDRDEFAYLKALVNDEESCHGKQSIVIRE